MRNELDLSDRIEAAEMRQNFTPRDIIVGLEFIRDGERLTIMEIHGWLGWVFPTGELHYDDASIDEENDSLGEIVHLKDIFRGLKRGTYLLPDEGDDSDEE